MLTGSVAALVADLAKDDALVDDVVASARQQFPEVARLPWAESRRHVAALLDAADSRQAACDPVHGQDADGCTPLQLAEQRLRLQQLGEERAPYQQPAGRLHDAQQTVCVLQAAASRLQSPERGCGG